LTEEQKQGGGDVYEETENDKNLIPLADVIYNSTKVVSTL